MGYTLTNPRVYFFDSLGRPLSNGKVYTYEAGTATPKDTYLDSTLTTTHPNPIVLDAGGSAEVWVPMGERYKIIARDEEGVTVQTTDNYVFGSTETVADYTELRAITGMSDGDSRVVTSQGLTGRFIYDSSQSGTDDGGVVIQGWVRQFDGKANLEWWEVTIEDTASVDNATALQKAFDWAASSTGSDTKKELYFAGGQIGLSSGIVWDRGNLSCEGASRRHSQFVALADMEYMFRHFRTDSTLSGGIQLQDFRIDCNGFSVDYPIWIDDANYMRVINVEVRESLGGGWRSANIEDCFFDLHMHKNGVERPLAQVVDITTATDTLDTFQNNSPTYTPQATEIQNGDVIRIVGAGAGGADLITTVLSGADTTQLTLADTASTTVTKGHVVRMFPQVLISDRARREGGAPEWETKICNSLVFGDNTTIERGRAGQFYAYRASACRFNNAKIHGRTASDDTGTVNITAATQAYPVVVTAANSFADGDWVTIASVGGMTELNGNAYQVANATASQFELFGTDGTGFTSYTTGGTATRVPAGIDLVTLDRCDRVSFDECQIIKVRRSAVRLRKSGGSTDPSVFINNCAFDQPANYVDATDITFITIEEGDAIIDGNIFRDDLSHASYTTNGIDINITGGDGADGINRHDNTPPGGGYVATYDTSQGRPIVSRRNRAAYILDDFTPALDFSSATGTITYTTQDGSYIRSGNMVHFSATVTVNTISGHSGNARITGLPWTAKNAAPGNASYHCVVRHSGLTATAGATVVGTINAGTQYVSLVECNGGAADSNLDETDILAGDRIEVTGWYVVAD